MLAILLLLTLIGMHLLGTAILFGYLEGPLAVIATLPLSLFGIFFILPEVMGIALIWLVYRPRQAQCWMRTLTFALIFGAIGAFCAAPLVPKPVNEVRTFWNAGLLAGSGAAVFAFACIHRIKLSRIRARLSPPTNTLPSDG